MEGMAFVEHSAYHGGGTFYVDGDLLIKQSGPFPAGTIRNVAAVCRGRLIVVVCAILLYCCAGRVIPFSVIRCDLFVCVRLVCCVLCLPVL